MLSPPISTLAPHQSLWHANRTVTCTQSTGRFTKGNRYQLSRDIQFLTRHIQTDSGIRWRITSKETEAAVWPESGSPMIFSMRDQSLQTLTGFLPVHPINTLTDYFAYDPVPTIADLHADQYEQYLAMLDAMPHKFQPRPFQRDGIARLALTDQALVAWDPGLGKTSVAFLWPLLKRARRTLIITPASLIPQTIRFGVNGFGIKPVQVRDPLDPYRKDAMFFIASYDTLFHQENGVLASCVKSGFDAVVIDEATIIQNQETQAGSGIWQLRPNMRLAMTATPIKNKIDSLANLLCWLNPAINPRHQADRKRMVVHWSEEYSAKAVEKTTDKSRRPAQRVMPANLHSLWAEAAPLIHRIQKSSSGEPVTPLTIEHHMVPPDRVQWHHYTRELAEKHCISSFQRLIGIACGIYGTAKQPASITNKLIRTIELARDNAGAPVLIGSTRAAFSNILCQSLRRLGIRAAIADGRTHPDERAMLAREFASGRLPVLIASLNSMSQGHDFPDCPTVILPTLALAFDDNEQFLHRVWRLTSSKPITVHIVSTSHSIDQRIAEIYLEKRAVTKLVIDGGTDIPDDLASDLDRPEVWDSIINLAHGHPRLTDQPGIAA